jgi:hypothetical protein
MHESTNQSEILPLIRAQVRERLTKSPAFLAMSPEQRAEVAHNTVNALHYIVGGEDGESRPGAMTLGGNADAFAGPGRRVTPQPKPGPPPAPTSNKPKSFTGQAGQDYADTVAAINFPAFVGGLIDGVFNSIVTTSIKQMEAYSEMVKNVSKSVDQYMKDNVTEGHARDYLADKYPDHLEYDNSADKPVLKAKEGADDGNMPDFFADLGLKSKVSSLDDDTVEQQLVPAARRRIAMDRQQLLATMVMMGVNRLVVTNGTIEASCFFELDTTDTRKASDRKNTSFDYGSQQHAEGGGGGETDFKQDWSGKWKGQSNDNYAERSGDYSGSYDNKSNWYSKSSNDNSARFKMTTARTRDSEQTVKMHAELGGKVKVNFKSDYFPMEKMVDALQVNQIRDKTAAGIAPQAAPAVAAPALPAPALPALPPMPTAPPPAAPAPAAAAPAK